MFFAEPVSDAAEGHALAAPPFWAGASVLFTFPTREDRERAVTALQAAPALGEALPGGSSAAAACSAILEADPTWLSRVTAAWQVGRWGMPGPDALLWQYRRFNWPTRSHTQCNCGRPLAALCSAKQHAKGESTSPPCCTELLHVLAALLQRGQLCNLDYLLFLNLASGRSFSDLSQVGAGGHRCCVVLSPADGGLKQRTAV